MMRIFLLSLILLCSTFVGCDEFESADTVDGMWICEEIRSGGTRKIYNIDIDRSSISDTTLFVIYNMFNLGYDFGVDVCLSDSLFTIVGPNNISLYSVSGEGILHAIPEDYRIEWRCNVAGPGINEPFVTVISKKR